MDIKTEYFYSEDRDWLMSSYLNNNGNIEYVVSLAILRGIPEKMAREFLYSFEAERKEEEKHLWP